MQTFKQAASVLALGFCLPLAACYPVYKTLQPHAEAQIRDERGAPLKQAEVALISNAYPRGTEHSRTLANTDENGNLLRSSLQPHTCLPHLASAFALLANVQTHSRAGCCSRGHGTADRA